MSRHRTDGGTDPLAAVQRRVRRTLVGFVDELRTAGVEVPADGALSAAEALAVVGFADEDRVRTALRAALCSRPEDVPTFDRLFERFWSQMRDAFEDESGAGGVDTSSLDGGFSSAALPDDAPDEEREAATESDDDEGVRSFAAHLSDGAVDADGDRAVSRFSPVGPSAAIEGDATPPGPDPASAVRALTDALRHLPGRRFESATEGTPDVRRAMRRSHGTGGTVMEVPRRAPRPASVRGLVLVDVSRSVLDTVDRGFLIRVLRTLVEEWREARVFLFDTDVTEVTGALSADSADAALQELERAEAAWGGGTRIGEAVTAVRERAPTAVDRDTVVLVVSDGLETGETADLETGMTWLGRTARRVFWFNPLAASTEYEPTCRGMETALPHLDGLFAFADPEDIADAARQLRRRDTPVGYEFDWRHT